MVQPQTPYQILGEEGIRELTNAFYNTMEALPDVQGIRGMHSACLEAMKERLAEYLIGWMGGPPIYLQKYGSICMTDPHKPFHIGPKERDEWLLCMDKALEAINASDELKAMLKQPMFDIADAVRNQEAS